MRGDGGRIYIFILVFNARSVRTRPVESSPTCFRMCPCPHSRRGPDKHLWRPSSFAEELPPVAARTIRCKTTVPYVYREVRLFSPAYVRRDRSRGLRDGQRETDVFFASGNEQICVTFENRRQRLVGEKLVENAVGEELTDQRACGSLRTAAPFP